MTLLIFGSTPQSNKAGHERPSACGAVVLDEEGVMLRKASNVTIRPEPRGCLSFWLPTANYIISVKGRGSWRIDKKHFEQAESAQQHTPVPLRILPRLLAPERRYWWYKDGFYWDDEGYTAYEVKALLHERETRTKRKLQRAIALMEQEPIREPGGRDPIPDDVKMFVWRRDGGKCVKCGSKKNLEYDHIIPVSMGGSNTARNIQLLCEECNRSKGASLA